MPMKKIKGLDERLITITGDEDPAAMITRRAVFQLLGNLRCPNADSARRIYAILSKLRDKASSDLVLEDADLDFLKKTFEQNQLPLSCWALGQVLDLIEHAETVA